MKIFIGVNNSCNLNYQHNVVYDELFKSFELTPNVSEADAIVIAETCCCTQFNLKYTLNYIASILKEKNQKLRRI